MILTLPDMEPIPVGSTYEQRVKMLWDYEDKLARMNPRNFLTKGIKKRWYHFFKEEHPATKRGSPSDN